MALGEILVILSTELEIERSGHVRVVGRSLRSGIDAQEDDRIMTISSNFALAESPS
jgi:hypothetical protein